MGQVDLPLVTVARLGRPRGLKGALHADQAGAHLRSFTGKQVYVEGPAGSRCYEILHADEQSVQFAGVSDRDAAARLTNQLIRVPLHDLKKLAAEERRRPPAAISELWYFELLGMRVIDAADHRHLGKIAGVEDIGLNSVVTIDPEAGSALTRVLEIPLDYPHWQAPDLEHNQIGLSEWQIFVE